MREAGASYKVAKNRLARIAIEGTPYASIGDMLTGPTALATSPDPVAAAKVVVEFAKSNEKLEIVGGAMGDTLLDVNGVKALATLPSLDELRAKIVGLVQAPATKIVQVVQAPGGQIARASQPMRRKKTPLKRNASSLWALKVPMTVVMLSLPRCSTRAWMAFLPSERGTVKGWPLRLARRVAPRRP